MPALYVHIPFCLSKCYYCDFVSAVHEGRLAERYVDALCREGELRAAQLATISGGDSGWLQAPTVYFGGGTPSTLEVDQLCRILESLRSTFGRSPDAEVTLEANPRTHVFTDAGKLSRLREAGFNRISIGAQTFDDDLLRLIGRGHGASDVDAAVSVARSEGFENISVDLIFALPGQTLAGWSRTLDRALGLGVEHISLYNLTIEEGTVFGERHRRGELEPAPSDLEADMYSLAIDRLTDAGLYHYEVSNFARPGLESRHNQAYWRLEDYLGLGVGAHSCIGNGRFAAGRNTLLHVQAVEAGRTPEEFREEMTPQEVLSEAMWLGLRLLRGVDLGHAARRSGLDPLIRYGETMRRLIQRGLLHLEHGALSLTRDGLFLGNQVFCEFA